MSAPTRPLDFPIILTRELTLKDLWVAYRTGARDARGSLPTPSDELIDRACDGYVKLVLLTQVD